MSLWLFAAPGTPGVAPPHDPPAAPGPSCWGALTGNLGSSSRWESGWIDLTKTTSLHAGDKVRLKVGGTAEQVLVRFLSKGDSADDPEGIENSVLSVSALGFAEVTLQGDHADVTQISVHGGPKPFGLYSLGGGNGPATLQGVEVCHK
jgi:hypothetical protein